MEWTRGFRRDVSLSPDWRLSGFEVVDSRQKDIAPLHDLLCDGKENRVRYLIVEIGGSVGIVGRKVLLPVEIMSRTGGGTVIINATLKEIQESPFVEDPYNPARDEEFAIYRHFRVKPYWMKIGDLECLSSEDDKGKNE